MEESILKTIKALLGPESDYDVFDTDIIIFINSAFSTLNQLGVGPAEGFRITDDSETWEDYLGDLDDQKKLDSVKEYIYLKVKMAFDPPVNSFVMSAYQETCKELEWRMNVAVDPGLY